MTKERTKWFLEKKPDKTFTEQIEDFYGKGWLYTYLGCMLWLFIALIIALLIIFIPPAP
jgi:ABC-type multidrug transport system permease subunit